MKKNDTQKLDINKYAADSVEEYPDVQPEWRRLKLRGFIEQAYRFGLRDGQQIVKRENDTQNDANLAARKPVPQEPAK